MTSQPSHLPDIRVNNGRCPLANCNSFNGHFTYISTVLCSRTHWLHLYSKLSLLLLWEGNKNQKNTFRYTIWHILLGDGILCKCVYKHTSEAHCARHALFYLHVICLNHGVLEKEKQRQNGDTMSENKDKIAEKRNNKGQYKRMRDERGWEREKQSDESELEGWDQRVCKASQSHKQASLILDHLFPGGESYTQHLCLALLLLPWQPAVKTVVISNLSHQSSGPLSYHWQTRTNPGSVCLAAWMKNSMFIDL